jgi:acylglycerol lipase
VGCLGLLTLVIAAFAVASCTHPLTQGAFLMSAPVTPRFDPENHVFVAEDGARLGLTVWPAKGVETPELVVVGVHGMNDYANAFHMAAPYWAENGVTTYAYDQRGFGRSPGRGIWPEEELMREDLRTAVRVARARHPKAVITVIGISMGGAVAMSAFGSDRPPAADRLIASGPGLRGWGAMNPIYKASLWASTHTRPGWIVRPPRRLVKIEPSDNVEMLRRTWSDPLMMTFNRIDQVYGVVRLMETAHMRAGRLPAGLPTLLSYGANDLVIPPAGVKRTSRNLPDGVRTVYYPNGYHMLLRDLQAESVQADYLAFMRDPSSPLPSGGSEWPWR